MARRQGYITEQVRRLNSGEINRRRFIMSALGAGVTLPTAMSLASRAEARVPRRGGMLRYGMASGEATDRLDPGEASNAMTEALQFARGNGLVEAAPSGRLTGELAESFGTPDGGRHWVFDLRRGVSFHDGRPLTSADVVATLEHQRRGTSAAAALLSGVGSVRADGPSRVVITMERPDAEFPWRLAEPQLVILAAEDGRIDPDSPNGTGGYILEKFEPGQCALFRRNPDYWKANAAHVEQLELITLPDPAQRQHAVMLGDVDVIDEVDPRTVALLSRVPNVDLLETPAARLCTFPMRLDTAPFDNPDLRLALKYAVDRGELVSRALLGHGLPGDDAPFGGGGAARDADPDRAAWHYRASGHGGPLRLAVSEAAFPGAVEAARLISGAARVAGIEVAVDVLPRARYWTGVWNRTGWCAGSWRARQRTALAAACFGQASPWDEATWRSGASAVPFDALVAEARCTEDEARRDGLYDMAGELVRTEGGTLLPMRANAIHAHSRALAHDGSADAKLAERWWFA
jgi:peptide/nickel transport system substrate-binding protein